MREKRDFLILAVVLIFGAVFVSCMVCRRLFIPLAGDCPHNFTPVVRRRASPAALTGGPAQAAPADNAVARLRPGVVGIRVGSGGTPPGWQAATPAAGNWSVGSGVVIHPRGYIVTNYHVVAAGNTITISVFDPAGPQEYPAQLVTGDPVKDLALLKIAPSRPLLALPMGDSDLVRTGDQVVAIGNPFGLTQTVTRGIVSARRKTLIIGNNTMNNLLQTDVAINPGNSGGALCNLQGELIGINVAIYSPVESVSTGISFAIPVNQVKALFGPMIGSAQPVNFQYVQAAQPGSYGQPVAAVGNAPFTGANPLRIPDFQRIMPSPGEGIEEIAWLGIDMTSEGNDGGEVDEIEGSSPMEAGLEAGDIIRKINGYPVTDMYALKDVIKKVPLDTGESVLMDVFRPRTNRNLFIGFQLKRWDIKGR